MMASDQPNVAADIRGAYDGHLMLNGTYDLARAQETLASGAADSIAFAYPFIANPDLVARFRHDFPLAEADPATFYTPGPEGYIDYPTYRAAAA